MASKNSQFKFQHLYREYIYLSATLAPHCEGGGVYDLSNIRFITINTIGGIKISKNYLFCNGRGVLCVNKANSKG